MDILFVSSEIFFLNRALQFADVIVLFGARLNWILHFGLPPRYQPDVKFIQVPREDRFKIRAVCSSVFSLSTIISSALFLAFIKNHFSL